ncbi:hypothetical protein LX16_2585 [Stackebrandtia albiflava]|uniref:Uncharacterized protein n=1 Tax=Stackebrandtia albiflava TaxID=406432 RepID=A0A562V1U5_9ACTN|nr:hypothetical protein [Stackebrandtia albiflava]TWJ11848.1 hypothetical protein LX16_2585 [Stackebrandtia albiflava]
MYDDNAWPETAAVSTFIPERKRPQRVTVAAIAFLVAALLAVLAGALYATIGTAASNFLLTMPWLVAVPVAALVAVWCAILGRVVWKGRRWAAGAALWSAVGLLAACGGFGAIANPKVSTMVTGAQGWFYAVVVIGCALCGAVALVGLVGRQSREWFDPPAQPNPFAQQERDGMPPIAGYDADWTPPQYRQPGAPGPQQGGPYPPQQPGPPQYRP